MVIKVNATGSNGNSYILENESTKEVLVIESGISYKELLKSVNFNIRNIKGCIVSHCHLDHNKYSNDYEKHGIKVFKPFEEFKKSVCFGGYKIMPFKLEHDTDCYGFLIVANDNGKEQRISFITDTEYCKYKFKRLTCLMVECNYIRQFIDKEHSAYEHIVLGHLELETTKGIVRANDNENMQSVILLHASTENADTDVFKAEIEKITDKQVYVAEKRLNVVLK